MDLPIVSRREQRRGVWLAARNRIHLKEELDMKARSTYVLAALLIGISACGAGAQENVVFSYWFGGGINNNLDTLKAHPDFPDNPHDGALMAQMDHPDMAGVDNWGARGQAFLTPGADGDYTFWIAADDDCDLWLSTDEDPANAVVIAELRGWCGYQDYAGTSGARGDNYISDPVTLVAGQRYYIEMVFSDGTGGGHGSIGWSGADIGDDPVPIPADVLSIDPAWIPAVIYQAKDPIPADGEVDVTSPLFEWTAGPTAVGHDVYFGTTPELGDADFIGNQGFTMYFHQGVLEPGVTYYWRVDQIDAAGTKTVGKVWSFTVFPVKATEPNPEDGMTFVMLEPDLSWKAGNGAVSHDVYVGTDEAAVAAGDPNVLLGSVGEAHYHLTTLELETTYYWRIDEVDALGAVVPGDVWSFTTLGAIENPIVEPNLIGIWTFDTEAADSPVAFDMTGNNHHGRIIGDIAVVESILGPALKLPGGDNQFVNIGPVGLSGNDPTTIACWAKADHTSIPDWTLIFGFTGTAEGQGGSGSHFNIGSLGGPGGVGAHCWGWEETIFDDNTALEWHHYAMTYDGTTITYYGDGIEMDTDVDKSNERDLAIRGDRVHIGSRITQASSFPGLVDDCRIYDRVLTADEIAALGVRAPTIAFVSFHGAADAPSSNAADAGFTEAPDAPYTDLLVGAGYNVMRYITTSSPDADLLNQADLVIISRSVSSGGYSNDGATAWNTIEAPMMILGGYVLRNSRMGYTTGGTMEDTTGDIKLTVSDPDHPIFAGIPLTDGTMDNPFAAVVSYADGTLARGVSINNNEADDEGTVLAVVAEASADTGPVGGMVIAEWPAGATLDHAGGAETDVLAGRRLVFLTGAREASGITSHTAGLFDLYDDGVQMYLNAVDYMLTPPPPPPIVVGLNNGGFEDGVLEPWSAYGDTTTELVTELVGAAVPEPVIEGTTCLYVQVGAGAVNFWDMGLSPGPVDIFQAGKKYTFSVFMKSKSGTVDINLKPELAADPWTGYGDQMVTVTEEWQEFSVTTPVFEADVEPVAITMHIGNATGGIWVDGARFYEGDYVAP
jgi:hypothetical protein